MDNTRFLPAGDAALSVEFGNEISAEINRRIRAFNIAIKQSGLKGITETVPTYRALMVHYQPDIIGFHKLIGVLKDLLGRLDEVTVPPQSVIEIPVLYGQEEGPDIEYVAEYSHKTVEEVISIHSSPEYLIYMLGFTPGFPYLGGMSKEIATPRLAQPRVKIAANSVGIAGEQTGIYTVDSPGGWQIIGKTPLCLYDAGRDEPILLEMGQYIKFRPIDKDEYSRIEAMVLSGSYKYVTYPKEDRL